MDQRIGSLSPDGLWLWDGQSWRSTISADGYWRWNGHAWKRSTLSGRRSRRHLLVISLVTLPFVLLFALLAGGELWSMHVGCGSVDPTDPANYSTVSIRNDTSERVTVGDCRGAYCALPDEPRVLGPGTETTVNAACGASGSDMTSWRLSNAVGLTIGYVAVDTPRKRDGLIYPVSRASRSRELPATPDLPAR